MASKFEYKDCVWEELTPEQLHIKLKSEIDFNKKYLEENGHKDVGRYLIFVIQYLPEMEGKTYNGFPAMVVTIKSISYPDQVEKISNEYVFAKDGYPRKEGPSMLVAKEK